MANIQIVYILIVKSIFDYDLCCLFIYVQNLRDDWVSAAEVQGQVYWT